MGKIKDDLDARDIALVSNAFVKIFSFVQNKIKNQENVKDLTLAQVLKAGQITQDEYEAVDVFIKSEMNEYGQEERAELQAKPFYDQLPSLLGDYYFTLISADDLGINREELAILNTLVQAFKGKFDNSYVQLNHAIEQQAKQLPSLKPPLAPQKPPMAASRASTSTVSTEDPAVAVIAALQRGDIKDLQKLAKKYERARQLKPKDPMLREAYYFAIAAKEIIDLTQKLGKTIAAVKKHDAIPYLLDAIETYNDVTADLSERGFNDSLKKLWEELVKTINASGIVVIDARQFSNENTRDISQYLMRLQIERIEQKFFGLIPSPSAGPGAKENEQPRFSGPITTAFNQQKTVSKRKSLRIPDMMPIKDADKDELLAAIKFIINFIDPFKQTTDAGQKAQNDLSVILIKMNDAYLDTIRTESEMVVYYDDILKTYERFSGRDPQGTGATLRAVCFKMMESAQIFAENKFGTTLAKMQSDHDNERDNGKTVRI